LNDGAKLFYTVGAYTIFPLFLFSFSYSFYFLKQKSAKIKSFYYYTP